jgi:ribonuclease P protein component
MPTFPKAVRLRHSYEFKRGFDQGVKVVFPCLVLFATKAPSSPSGSSPDSPPDVPSNTPSFSIKSDSEVLGSVFRLGLVVSKKVGNSVVRNRTKRVLRAAFCQIRLEVAALLTTHPLIGGLDLVVLARPQARDLGAPDAALLISSSIRKLISKLEAQGQRPAPDGHESSRRRDR